MNRAETSVAQFSPTVGVYRLLRRLLRLSLEMKLLIPNLVVIAIAIIVFGIGMSDNYKGPTLEYVVVFVLGAGAAINFSLVRIALRPVHDMRLVAEQVANGNFDARVQPSVIADPGLAQLATTFNDTLDYLSLSREQMRERGARIVYAQESERAHVAKELHESIGQTLAAASYQAAAAANMDAAGSSNALEVARLLRTAIDDLRSMSRELHPRIADDLGLPAALESLARATMERSLLDVHLSVKGFNEPISSAASSTLYRVAQQVLRNIEAHASSGTVHLSLSSRQSELQLQIDDNCTFEDQTAIVIKASLIPLAERLALLGGKLTIESNFRGGTRVTANLTRQLEAA